MQYYIWYLDSWRHPAITMSVVCHPCNSQPTPYPSTPDSPFKKPNHKPHWPAKSRPNTQNTLRILPVPIIPTPTPALTTLGAHDHAYIHSGLALHESAVLDLIRNDHPDGDDGQRDRGREVLAQGPIGSGVDFIDVHPERCLLGQEDISERNRG